MAHPAAKHGILTGFGGTVRLPEVLGERNAARLFQSLEQWGVEEALKTGAIHRRLGAPEVQREVLVWLRSQDAARPFPSPPK